LCWRRQITYEACDILHRDAAIDVVLTDRRMPGTTDVVMTAARRENPDLKWMIASAGLPNVGPRAWLDGYIQKPCEVAQPVRHFEALSARERPAQLKRAPA
jgi:CheY-like chemotaxis protein